MDKTIDFIENLLTSVVMKLRERNQTLISVIINPNSQRINVNNLGPKRGFK